MNIAYCTVRSQLVTPVEVFATCRTGKTGSFPVFSTYIFWVLKRYREAAKGSSVERNILDGLVKLPHVRGLWKVRKGAPQGKSYEKTK